MKERKQERKKVIFNSLSQALYSSIWLKCLHCLIFMIQTDKHTPRTSAHTDLDLPTETESQTHTSKHTQIQLHRQTSRHTLTPIQIQRDRHTQRSHTHSDPHTYMQTHTHGAHMHTHIWTHNIHTQRQATYTQLPSTHTSPSGGSLIVVPLRGGDRWMQLQEVRLGSGPERQAAW